MMAFFQLFELYECPRGVDKHLSTPYVDITSWEFVRPYRNPFNQKGRVVT